MDNLNSNNSNNTNKTMLWIAGGCLALIVCGLAVAVFGFGGLMWLGIQSPENAAVNVNAPLNAGVGDDIQIQISITNTSSEPMELASIDFSLNYLNGFNVYRVEPPYSETSQYDALGGGETFQTYYFNRAIAPGETLVIVFEAQAILAGDFSGTVDICIDSDFNCISNIPRTVVK